VLDKPRVGGNLSPRRGVLVLPPLPGRVVTHRLRDTKKKEKDVGAQKQEKRREGTHKQAWEERCSGVSNTISTPIRRIKALFTS